MSGFRVAICHQSVVWGDAIGHDIVAMYRLLKALGGQPLVVCESHRHLASDIHSSLVEDVDWASLSLIIYHHSQYWAAGERLLRSITCPVLLRYHNITPPQFFAPYSPLYATVCAEGRLMTERLLAMPVGQLWIADSAYNKEDLVAGGADPSTICVVPPFNRLHKLLPNPNQAHYPSERFEFLFVGRLAPNKGHSHLFRLLRAFLSETGKNAVLRIVGVIDPELNSYYVKLLSEIEALGLQGHVELLPHCSDDDLLHLFRTSHAYLCFSEHEGYCVPVVEAQAVGLPVIGSAESAVPETAGPEQFIGDPPRCPVDYSFYAAVVNRVLSDEQLRSQVILQGERNVRTRFSREAIENAFTGALNTLLP